MQFEEMIESVREFLARPRVRVVISRGTAIVAAIVLLLACYKVGIVARRVQSETIPVDTHSIVLGRRKSNPAGFLWLISFVLGFVGLLLGMVGAMPGGWMAYIFRPRAPKTGINPEPPLPRRWF